MNHSRLTLLAAVVSVILPLSALVPGCGGGGNSRPTSTATPIGGGVVSGTAASGLIDLGNNQSATLTVSMIGSSASGVLTVNARSLDFQSAQSTPLAVGTSISSNGPNTFDFEIPAGDYPLSGTFSTASGFAATGNFGGSIGKFTVGGSLPTSVSDGAFILVAKRQSVSGVFGRSATPTAIATGGTGTGGTGTGGTGAGGTGTGGTTATPSGTTSATPIRTTSSTPVATTSATPRATNGATPMATNGATPVATNGATPMATNGATPVATNGATPMATNGATPVATNGATPVATVGATPLARKRR